PASRRPVLSVAHVPKGLDRTTSTSSYSCDCGIVAALFLTVCNNLRKAELREFVRKNSDRAVDCAARQPLARQSQDGEDALVSCLAAANRQPAPASRSQVYGRTLCLRRFQPLSLGTSWLRDSSLQMRSHFRGSRPYRTPYAQGDPVP